MSNGPFSFTAFYNEKFDLGRLVSEDNLVVPPSHSLPVGRSTRMLGAHSDQLSKKVCKASLASLSFGNFLSIKSATY